MSQKNSISPYDFKDSLKQWAKFVFFDLESNFPESRVEWTRAAISDMEIIQIGYAVFDYRFNILERKSIIIKPEFIPKISLFIEGLTGISQSKADGGVSFMSAMHEFACVVQSCEYAISWGTYDHLQLEEDFKRNGLPKDQGFFSKLLSGKELVSGMLGTKSHSLQSQMRALGIKPEWKHHDAMWDAVNGVRIIESVFQI